MFPLILLILVLLPSPVRADFVLDMTLCRPPAMTTCETLHLLARRGIWACHIGAPRIVKKVETMNPSAKWKLKTYHCRSVPNGTKI